MIQKPPKFTGTVDLDGDEEENHDLDHEAGASAHEEPDANAAAEFADEFDTDHDFPESAEAEDVDLEADAARRKRNGTLITYGGGAVFFLIILIVGYFQFAPLFSGASHSHAAGPVPKAPVRNAAQQMPANNNILLPPPGSAMQAGLVMPNGQPVTIAPGSAMAQATDNSYSEPAPAPQAVPMPQQLPQQASAPVSSAVPDQAMTKQISANQPPAQAPDTMMPAYQASQPAQVQTPTQAPMQSDVNLVAKVDDLANQVSALQASIATLTATENASPQLQQIQNSLDALQRQVSGMPAPRQGGEIVQKAEKATSSHSRHTSHGIVKAVPAMSDTSQAAEPAPTPRHEAPAHLESGQGGGWILRAAMPGSAMIGKPGSNDLQHVGIGDTVSGLGRIVSISDAGGRWVVKGTSGSIGQ